MKIKDYFAFNRSEKRGTVVVLLIVVALIASNFIVQFFKSNTQTDFSEFETAINEFEKERNSTVNNKSKENLAIELFDFNPNTISDSAWRSLGFKNWQIKTINNYKAKGGNWKTKADVSNIYGLKESHFDQLEPYILLPDKVGKEANKDFKEKHVKIEYFSFNPNTISKTQWKKLGFKDWQIKTIFNYKAKGGSWETKADVKKIYGLSEANYLKLEPYILLPANNNKTENAKNKKDYTLKVNINTATAKELTNLKGIYSEKYAAIIIKYRNSLGGFVKKEQLKEVWKMEIETYNGFVNQLELGIVKPKRFNINTAKATELKTHPYISWNIANAIKKYRKIHGKYKKLEDIKKIQLISNETYLKIKPYLKIN